MNAVVLMSAALLGQCQGGSCPAPSRSFGPAFAPSLGGEVILGEPIFVEPAPVVVLPAAKPAPTRQYGWHQIEHEGLTFRVWGYSNGGKITWDSDLPENARNWREAKHAAARPKPAPKKADDTPRGDPPVKQEVGQIPNFGVAPDRIGKAKEYTADTAEARRFVAEATGGAEDAGLLHVTVIGSADDCAPVVNDIRTSPAFAQVRDRLMVQDYRPGEWAVDPKLGYVTNGKPTILVQQARSAGDPNGGRVVYRAMDYSIGAEGLAEAIRKADPGYRPDKDPGPSQPAGGGACPLGFTRDHWPVILVVGVVLAIVLFRPSKEPKP